MNKLFFGNEELIPIIIDPRVTHRQIGDIPNCTPPVHVKSLLEEANLDPDVSNERCAFLYAKACRDYLDGNLPGNDSWETWKSIVTQIGKIGGIA